MKPPVGNDDSLYAFGPFRIDLEARTLLRDGAPVPLLPKSFDALAVLVRHPGTLLDKDFLLREIWPDTHVEENNLARAISDIRKALGEGPKDQRYVVTVPRRGYRFAPSVAPVDSDRSGPPAPASEVVSVPTHESPVRSAWRRPALLGAAVVLATVFLVGWLLAKRAPDRPLADRDVLVLADFANNTGDPVFDDTLREALAVQLEQSPFLKVMDDAQMRQTLQLMGRDPDKRVTSDTARDVCRREREKATIGGSIARLETSYTILLHATTCETGETLAREQVDAYGKTQVLAALRTAANGMRRKLGESLGSIESPERHAVTEVTTPSLEAFQAYARGADHYRRGLFLQAVPFFRRAIELDPDFAMAHQLLANAYGNAGERALSIEYSAKAFVLADSVSERERLAISAVYHMRVTGDATSAAQALRLFVETFPRASIPRSYRGTFYMSMGQFERAAEDFEEMVRLDPRGGIPRMNLMGAYLQLGRLADAKAVAQTAPGHTLDAPGIHQMRLALGLMEEDSAAVAREVRWFEGRDDAYVSLDLQASEALIRGQRHRASGLLQAAAGQARAQNLGAPADLLAEAAAADPYGDCQVEDTLTKELRACRDLPGVLAAVESEAKARPADTLLNAVQLPVRRAALDLRRGEADRAVTLLESARPYERRYPEVVYVRAMALLESGRYREAAAEFQKLVDWKGLGPGVRLPLAYLGLGRAASRAGDAAGARTAYERLLELWREADADLPVLSQAKLEYTAGAAARSADR